MIIHLCFSWQNDKLFDIRGDELVLKCFLYVQSLDWVNTKERDDEVLGSLGKLQLLRELQICKVNLFVTLLHHIHNLLLIRGFPSQQLESQNAYSPDINFLVVVAVVQLLRTTVLETTDDSSPQTLGKDRTAKVSQFHIPLNITKKYLIHEDVLRFNVPVDDVVLVHIRQSLADLSDNVSSLFLWRAFPTFHLG